MHVVIQGIRTSDFHASRVGKLSSGLYRWESAYVFSIVVIMSLTVSVEQGLNLEFPASVSENSPTVVIWSDSIRDCTRKPRNLAPSEPARVTVVSIVLTHETSQKRGKGTKIIVDNIMDPFIYMHVQ